MKKVAYLFSMPLFLMACQSTPVDLKQPIEGIDLKQPAAQVLCDQYLCANPKGVSKELTKKYLGQVQADKIFSQGQFDLTQFTFANGIFCDTQTQKCHIDRYFSGDGKRSDVAENYTKALFGQ